MLARAYRDPGAGLAASTRFSHVDARRTSDNASANALEVWLGGSTSAGSQRVNELMRSIGLTRHLDVRRLRASHALASRIPVRVDEQPAYGYGKHTTAWDIATLLRAVWLASGGRGPLRADAARLHAPPTPATSCGSSRTSRDVPKLDRVRPATPASS